MSKSYNVNPVKAVQRVLKDALEANKKQIT